MHLLCMQHHTGDTTEVQKTVKKFTNRFCNLHKIFLCLKKAKIEFWAGLL